MPHERRSTDPGRRARDKGGSSFRALVITALLCLTVAEGVVAAGMYLWIKDYKARVHQSCVDRNAQWDAVVAKDEGIIHNTRTRAVVADIVPLYEHEIQVLREKHVDCDNLRAEGNQR